ncbi:uncharacterized protein LOC141528942 [Cotesia typhae]
MESLHVAQEISKKKNEKMFDPNDILKELQSDKNEYDSEKVINNEIKIFQKLLNFPMKITNSNNWEPVVVKLIASIATNNKIRDTKILLASQVCFTVLIKTVSASELKNILKRLLSLQIKKLFMFTKEFNIYDLELFKLTIIHGYFFVINRNSPLFVDVCTNSFAIIQRNCLVYSKYNYFAFHILKIWLEKIKEIKFWQHNHPSIEKDLETIIFSSWDHSISEIAKINALKIFPLYLTIMENKYPGFLEYSFQICKKNLSWQSTTKFTILSEICNLWNGCPDFHYLELKIIIKSLEKHDLKHVSTKLYLALINKISENKWIELIMDELCIIAEIWERENNINPLKILWEFWMRPTLHRFNSIIIPLLWARFCAKNMIVCQSYLARKAGELGRSWAELNSKNLKINSENQFNVVQWTCSEFNPVPPIINDQRDCVKLNIFGIQCHKNNSYGDINSYELIKHFLYFNINACSVLLRKGILDSFETLLRNTLQSLSQEDIDFVGWLDYLILDCFEPGSCYQRKIMGLKLYGIILKSIKKLSDSLLTQQMHNIIQSLHNKYHLFILFKLCLDPIDEIRNVSSNIIDNYFDLSVLTNDEIDTLLKKSEAMKISSKFYELCGGVKLLILISKIPEKQNPFYHNNNFILYDKLFESANLSLDSIKSDLLKGLIQGSDFNGSLMAIKELIGNSNTLNVSDIYLKNLINLLEESAEFFISALSPKSSQVHYSASFAEMGIAIDETIKNSDINDEFDNQLLSPAHQIIISNIWMGLKNICELAANFSIKVKNFDYVKRSLELIISVLLKCRHKGAIEAAGCALGMAVQSLSRFEKYTCLFDSYLNKLLNLDNDDKINLTRRGAGLSIMFHKMVVNYNKATRRLLHVAVCKILESLIDSNNKYNNDSNSNQDSPSARLLHFLRSIVVDKSLHVDLIPYIETISLICFQHLQSSEWAIRNASLQLLGAVIPRLVGQCSDNELSFGTGYSVNHFVTHYPKLSEFVLEQLKNNSSFNFDGTIVPILTLLSRMSVGGCQFTDYSSQKYINKLKTFLRILFDHPVENVRYLAAKSYAALIPTQKIYSELLDMKMENLESKSRNFLHGHLLVQICLQESGTYTVIDVENFSNNLHAKNVIKKFSDLQIKRVDLMIDYWTNNEEMCKKPLCNIIETTFLQSLIILSMRYTDKLSVEILLKSFDKILKSKKNKNYIGEPEMINYLVKLIFLVIKLENIDQSYISQIISTNNEDIIYYFVKHLRHELKTQKLRLKNFNKSDFIEKRSHLFEAILLYNYLNNHVFIDLVKVAVEIMKYDGRNRNLYLCESNNKIADKMLGLSKKLLINDRNKKVNQLAYTLIVLCIQHCYVKNENNLDRFYEIKKNLIDYIVDVVHSGDKEDKIWAIECLFALPLFHFDHFSQTHIIESLISLLCDETNEIRIIVAEKFRNSAWSTQWNKINQCWFIASIDSDDLINDSDNILNDRKNFITKELKSPEIHFYELICVLGSFMYHKCNNEDESLQIIPNVMDNCNMKCILDTMEYFVKSIENSIATKSSLESPFDHHEIYREDIKIFHMFFNCIASQSFKKHVYKKKQYIYELDETGSSYLESYIFTLTKLENNHANKLSIVLDIKSKDYLTHEKTQLYRFLKHINNILCD